MTYSSASILVLKLREASLLTLGCHLRLKPSFPERTVAADNEMSQLWVTIRLADVVLPSPDFYLQALQYRDFG